MDSENSKSVSTFTGSVVYIYAFDLAHDMKRMPIEKLLGASVEEYVPQESRRMPKQVFFYRPKTVTLAKQLRVLGSKQIEIHRKVKIFDIGALSLQFVVPFEVKELDELVNYHEIVIDGHRLEDEVMELAEQVRKELEPFCIRPVPQLILGEAYTLFCVDEFESARNAEKWFEQNRKRIAAILTQETDRESISVQEAEESTSKYLTYYNKDLIVADWDAALILGEKDDLKDIIHVMELANVQLVELAAYDRILDNAIQQAYRDLAKPVKHTARHVHRNLREIRIDLARLNDELLNITKFFGDWHLSRIYSNLSDRFHLKDWNEIITEKLKTLGDLYQMFQQDYVNKLMVILEAAIVLLFILDVLLLLLGL